MGQPVMMVSSRSAPVSWPGGSESVSALDDRFWPLAGIDQQVIRLLNDSEADAGLGAHVAASTGEPVRG